MIYPILNQTTITKDSIADVYFTIWSHLFTVTFIIDIIIGCFKLTHKYHYQSFPFIITRF